MLKKWHNRKEFAALGITKDTCRDEVLWMLHEHESAQNPSPTDTPQSVEFGKEIKDLLKVTAWGKLSPTR